MENTVKKPCNGDPARAPIRTAWTEGKESIEPVRIASVAIYRRFRGQYSLQKNFLDQVEILNRSLQ